MTDWPPPATPLHPPATHRATNPDAPTAHRTVRVDLGPRSYEVHIGPGLLDQLGEHLRQRLNTSKALIVADAAVESLYGLKARAGLAAAGLTLDGLTFPSGEAAKSWSQAGELLGALLTGRLTPDRATPLIALGGGVAGDLVGFVAGLLKRGVPWVQVPTTLLAQVDASVGGKTAVNHAAGKNLIGLIHQPALVLADVETLASLPGHEFRSGLAEVVKHAVIADAELFDRLERDAAAIVAPWTGEAGRPPSRAWLAMMTDLVATNVAIKARVVEMDETETGPRAMLNFGHTVGHALEAADGYGRLPHGYAVALGMVAETAIAHRRGQVSTSQAQRLTALLAALGLPTSLPNRPPEQGPGVAQLMALIAHDKKNRAGRIGMALPVGWGSAELVCDIRPDELAPAMASIGVAL